MLFTQACHSWQASKVIENANLLVNPLGITCLFTPLPSSSSQKVKYSSALPCDANVSDSYSWNQQSAECWKRVNDCTPHWHNARPTQYCLIEDDETYYKDTLMLVMLMLQPDQMGWDLRVFWYFNLRVLLNCTKCQIVKRAEYVKLLTWSWKQDLRSPLTKSETRMSS